MGGSRRRRIGSREVEQLLTADPDASAYPGLSELLAAAAAPPRPDELVGLRTALAAFEAAGRQSRTSGTVVRGRRGLARSVVVKVAAAAAVLLFGGTALAASGNLPGSAQQHVHDVFSGLGVPAPDVRSAPTVPAVTPGSTVPVPTPGSTVPVPTPGTAVPGSRDPGSRDPGSRDPSETPGRPRTATPGPPSAATRGLCRSWEARRKHPKKKPMPAEPLRRLAAAAGGAEHIAAFCAALLRGGPGAAATQDPAGASPTPAPPGKGKSKKKDKDKEKVKDKDEDEDEKKGKGEGK